MVRLAQVYEPVKPRQLNFDEERMDQRLKDLLVEYGAKREDYFWDNLRSHVLRSIKLIVEGCLNEEVEEKIGVGWYQRNVKRQDQRNGTYRRDLDTTFGCLKDLLVPRLRKNGKKTFKVFKRYKRRIEDVDGTIKNIFLVGASTRRVQDVLKPLLGYKYSPQLVSNVLKGLDEEVRKFHDRRISDDYIYLFFDGITIKIRHNGKVRKKRVLVCYGIRSNGKREIVDYGFAKGESTIAWEIFINSLWRRGLKGANLKLITTDGNQGLLNALDFVYPTVHKQRCWVHKLRNVANKCKKVYEKDLMKDARKIYLAKSKKGAKKAFKEFKEAWKTVAPEAFGCLQENIEELLYFFDCPRKMWIKIRTTNVIERSFREVRRRIRTISSFTNVPSCDRIVYGVITHLNTKWEEKPLKGVLVA